MKVIAEIPPTPEEQKNQKRLFLRPHVYIDEPEEDQLVNDQSEEDDQLDLECIDSNG